MLKDKILTYISLFSYAGGCFSFKKAGFECIATKDSMIIGRKELKKMEDAIMCICRDNEEKIYKDDKYNKIVQQRCGKNRLLVVSKIIEKETGNDLICE